MSEEPGPEPRGSLHSRGETAADGARAGGGSLRRFVHPILADRLARGEAVDSGERIVTIAFADLRDYTRLAESRSAAEIFTFLSTYTRVASEVIHAWGGLLLELSGDGAMAVFGAPEDLPYKEEAALSAATELVEVMTALGLSIGVGIATGPAFVGCLPSADRLFWCAVGNTTILASRLQALARPLGASVVADRRTVRDAMRPGFVRHESMRIRGRRRPETVFALPATLAGAGLERRRDEWLAADEPGVTP